MNRLTDHLIVISFDCLSALDLPIIQSLPHFQTILQQGSMVEKVETIYPSVTYPCHATIVTGKYPNKHGVINNTLLQPGRTSPDWNWFRSAIKGTTLYDEVKKANLTTAALLWPVTGKANIDYNLPEIFANRPWQHQILVSLFSGSPSYQWDLNKRFGSLRNGLNQPELDDFVLESTIHTIKTKKPNLLMVHFTDLDTQRHYHGFSSKEATEAIHRHDERLGRILASLEESGINENSTIVVLGDHSALDESVALHPNVLFQKQKLISLNRSGKINNWKAYCKSCDGSAYIYLKDNQDAATLDEVKKLLDELQEDPESGIETVLTGEQAAEMGADGDCSFMVEARKGYFFLEDYQGEYQKKISSKDVASNKKYTFACHGYSPNKENYQTIFMAAGKGIRQNVRIPYARLIDEGPTLARILGVDLGDTDGTIIEELLTI
ncbi:ectonucleotide pyrophosphatase/phosphodiesterase [Neobacillus sp. FSL H8-0543]|uniref:alkaline phosphatase family protein n=1 Tax=Neobacillus sp. FSL H8-0543 TaxID=2954672 RepID=UPI00315833DE